MSKQIQETSTQASTLYSKGHSSLMIYYYNNDLAICFVPYVGDTKDGRPIYDNKKMLNATINHKAASHFRQTAMDIVTGRRANERIKTIFPINNRATLVLEYNADPDDKKAAYLRLETKGSTLTFKFKTDLIQVKKKKNQSETEIFQTGLDAFAKVLEGYLFGINVGMRSGR